MTKKLQSERIKKDFFYYSDGYAAQYKNKKN